MSRGWHQVNYIYLKPGELACAKRPTVISTILGSCVSIVLYAPRIRMGCMCHAVLPDSRGVCGTKFVDEAISAMLGKFDRMKIARDEIVIRLFGGGEVLSGIHRKAATITIAVGHLNVAAAREAVEWEGLTIAASDVGGCQGRKIIFYAHTGEVFVKKFKINYPARKKNANVPYGNP
jgi:chemotaxis protein CheD